MYEEEKPNADLIGRTIGIGDSEWTITGSPSWSAQYLLLVRAGEPGSGNIEVICRPTALVRQHFQRVGQ